MAPGTFGIIAPHPPIFIPAVGGHRRHTADASLACAVRALPRRSAAFRPDTVVLMSPHAPLVGDAFLVDTGESLSGSLAQFGDADRVLVAGRP